MHHRGSIAAAALAVLVLLLAGCAGGPAGPVTRTVTTAPTDTGDTLLAARVRALGDPGDGRSGVRLLPDGIESLALRLALADRAERSIDAQYYLFHGDDTGRLLAAALLRAADRGVRVRLLLDDMDTRGYDAMTAALTAHPNMEIRLFNPFWRDRSQALAALTEFGRINRRMHNKSITFDAQVTIIGGRNIGDEYFAARDDQNYYDLDVLAAGPVARQVSDQFDAYWNSPFAVPAEAVIGDTAERPSLEEARARLFALAAGAEAGPYGDAMRLRARQTLEPRQMRLDWVPATVFADPPEKAAGAGDEVPVLGDTLEPIISAARNEVIVSSAYFVPGPRGTDFLTGLAGRGVRVAILTNSLDSTDVAPVHGHYSRQRVALLEGGVELYELRVDQQRVDRTSAGLGQSLSGLHTKAFAIDRERMFIGSFNWDPRSLNINTELGVLIESPALTREVIAGFTETLPERAYRLELDGEGGIDWLTRREDGAWLLYREEPASSAWRAFVTGVYGALPIRGQL